MIDAGKRRGESFAEVVGGGVSVAEFNGKVFPVNPKEKSILGLRCYPQVSEIPGTVDVALITTPAKSVPGILEDCGKKAVRGAVVIAGGFGELPGGDPAR